MIRELCRLMSSLTLVHCQVRLVWSPLSKGWRDTLEAASVIQGQMCVSLQPNKPLECRAQVNKGRQRSTLLCGTSPPSAPCSAYLSGTKGLNTQLANIYSPIPNSGHGHKLPMCRSQPFLSATSQVEGGFCLDACVLKMLSSGYSDQFRHHHPPNFDGVRITVVKHPLRSLVLRQEVSTQGTTKSVNSSMFYSNCLLVL